MSEGHMRRLVQVIASISGLAAGHLIAAPTHAQACVPISEGGYEVTRCQTTTKPPLDSVGWKTIDRETRVGNTPETDGNSRTFVLVVGTFAKKCPTAEGKVAGTFEFEMTMDEVNTDEGETQRTHYRHRLLAKLEGQVGDDGALQYAEIEGEVTREREGTPTERIPLRRQRFTPGRGGAPDWEAMRRAVEATGDLSPMTAILYSDVTYIAAEVAWREPNQCVELAFDPPSDTKSLAPNESTQVRVELRAFDGSGTVSGATLEANGLDGAGTVSPRQAKTQPDAPATFTYAAPATRQRPSGFDVATLSRAGAATGKWRVLDGLKLAIEHRLLSRRDTPQARVGRPLYDGTVRFEINLEPFPTLPGEFRGETTVVRQFSVGHITPRCAGQGSQSETWRVNATVDATTGTVKLGFAMFGDDLTAYWICDGQRDEVTSRFRSALKLMETPLTMPSRSGTRQTFSPSGPLFQETLTVTIP